MALRNNIKLAISFVTKSGKHHARTYWRGVTIREDYLYGPELFELYFAFLSKQKRMDGIYNTAMNELRQANFNQFKIGEFVYFRQHGLHCINRYSYRPPNNYDSSPLAEMEEVNQLVALELNGKTEFCRVLDRYYVVNQILTDICFGLHSFIERIAWNVDILSEDYGVYKIRYLRDFGYLTPSTDKSVHRGYEVVDITDLFNDLLASLHE